MTGSTLTSRLSVRVTNEVCFSTPFRSASCSSPQRYQRLKHMFSLLFPPPSLLLWELYHLNINSSSHLERDSGRGSLKNLMCEGLW